MKIDETDFGSITIAGKTYEHDVVVRLSDTVVKRKKKLSKRLYGTPHTVSEDEARFVFEKGRLRGRLGGDLASLLLQKRSGLRRQCGVAILAGAEDQFLAIKIYNLTRKPKVGLFHVTC